MDRNRMGELLIAEGLLSEEQVRIAVQAHETMGRGVRFGDYLVELGLLSARGLAHVLGRQFHLEVVGIDDLEPDLSALQAVSRAMATRVGVLPLGISDGQLTVAVSDPLDFGIPKALASESRMRVRIVLASEEEIRRGITRWYGLLETEDLPEHSLSPDVEPAFVQPVAEARGPGDTVLKLVRRALQEGARELVFSPTAEGVRILLHGPSGRSLLADLSSGKGRALLAELRTRAGLENTSTRRPQAAHFELEVDGAAVNVELALLPTLLGERALLSIQARNDSAMSLEELPVTRSNLATLDALVQAPGGGLILWVGLPGEDLRTLLVAVAQRLDPNSRVVAMIEDGRAPLVESVIQVATQPGAGGLSHAEALAGVLLQAPTAVIVNDLRDSEVATLAVQAALSGVQVIAGMRASGPSEALERLLHMGVEPVQLARALQAVGFQRWTDRLCGACREEVSPTASELQAFKLEAFMGQVRLFLGRGCPTCHGAGVFDSLSMQALAPVLEDDRRQLMGGERPWELFMRLQEAMIYDGAAKAVSGYVSARAASQVMTVL